MAAPWGEAGRIVAQTIRAKCEGVEREVASRAYRASNELRNAALRVLSGTRSGRIYRMPGTYGQTPTKGTRALAKKLGRPWKGGGQLWRASAPGEPPAVRTGKFRLSWAPHVKLSRGGEGYEASAAIESDLKVGGKYLLGEMLENGTKRMAPRPYKQRVIDMAMPKIQQIFSRPY